MKKSNIFFLSVLANVVLIILTINLFKHSRQHNINTHRISRGGLSDAMLDYTGQYKSINLDRKHNLLYADTQDRAKIVFTIDPELQRTGEMLLRTYNPVVGIVVLVDTKTSSIKTLVAYSRRKKEYFEANPLKSFVDALPRTSTYPMASLVKIITASAAIESKKLSSVTTCPCRGNFRIRGEGTIYDPRGVVHGNITMADGLAYSCNPCFAYIGLKIGSKKLEEYLDKFYFGKPIPFDFPVLESQYGLLQGGFNTAQATSGFDGVYLSPIHAAMIANTIANEGRMQQLHLISKIDKNGEILFSTSEKEIGKPIQPKTANLIADMMYGTIEKQRGTAHRGFYIRGRRIVPANIKIAGKTGSIDGNKDDEKFTWFIGHTKGAKNDYAIATMIWNDEFWKIKAASFSGQYLSRILKAVNKQ